MAIAPPFTFSFSWGMPSSRMLASTWAANASFSSIRSMSSIFEPGPLQRQPAWRAPAPRPCRRAPRPAAPVATTRASGSAPSCFAFSSEADRQARGAVVDLRRVAGGHGAALAEHGLELGQPLGAGVGARALVGVHGDRVALGLRRVHGDQLVVEAARPPGRRSRGGATPARTRPDPRATRRNARPRSPPSRPSSRCRAARASAGLTRRQPIVVSSQLHAAAGKAALGLEAHHRRPAHRLHAAGQHQVALARP